MKCMMKKRGGKSSHMLTLVSVVLLKKTGGRLFHFFSLSGMCPSLHLTDIVLNFLACYTEKKVQKKSFLCCLSYTWSCMCPLCGEGLNVHNINLQFVSIFYFQLQNGSSLIAWRQFICIL